MKAGEELRFRCERCGDYPDGEHGPDDCIMYLDSRVRLLWDTLEYEREQQKKWDHLVELERVLFNLFGEHGPSCMDVVYGIRLIQQLVVAQTQEIAQLKERERWVLEALRSE